MDDIDAYKSLSFGEKEQLEEWFVKFRDYKNYPVVGRLVPEDKIGVLTGGDTGAVLSPEIVAKCIGGGEPPEGYAVTPIYVGCGDNYYDVSFGGNGFYSEGNPYHRFAGKDASRALAKMSFEKEDIQSTSLKDLEEKSLKILHDWVKTFKDKKGYPVVGRTGQNFEKASI